ncbi:MBL fold metallo-hydrolase [Geodermatophilus sp. SYSU D00758]
MVDPSLEVGRRGGLPADVGLIAVTHAHEDRVAGLHVFPDVPVVAHPSEGAAVRAPEALLAGFGMAPAEADVLRRQLHETFGVTGHERVGTVDDGAVLDLGRRSVTVVHLPGHRRPLRPAGRTRRLPVRRGHRPDVLRPLPRRPLQQPRRPAHLDRTAPRRGGPLVRDLAPGRGPRRPAVLPRRPGPLRRGGRPPGRDAAAAAAPAADAGRRRRPPAGVPAARPVAVRRRSSAGPRSCTWNDSCATAWSSLPATATSLRERTRFARRRPRRAAGRPRAEARRGPVPRPGRARGGKDGVLPR